jgi:CheY-like chemotaxis protein
MEPAPHDGMPGDVLIVEDDPIIALDFGDTILGFGVKAVRTAGDVARALDLIADRAPDFALLDVSLTRELRDCRAAGGAGDPLHLHHRIWRRCQAAGSLCRQAAAAQTLFDRRTAGPAEKPGRQSGRGLMPALLTLAHFATLVWDRASSTTAPYRRDPARSPSSALTCRRS